MEPPCEEVGPGKVRRMAKKIRFALWWHMHQPCYRDTASGRLTMPLTFLHAVKDYYDMLRLGLGREGVRTTFNLVPSLMDQIELSGRPDSDVFIETLLKRPEDLDEEELSFLLQFLFLGDVSRQVLPLTRYYHLYEKWERRSACGKGARLFLPAEILDLEVLFLLSWTGTVLREEEPFVRTLIARESHFTQEEKEELVRILQSRVSAILGSYRQALTEGQIEITTTPYYHPILPLLFNFENVRAVEKDLPLPSIRCSLEDDAALQVEKSMARFKAAFGASCRGMWPAEGAVSSESLALMERHGIEYAGSDEEVLANSLGLRFPDFGGNRELVYRPWKVRTAGGEISVLFRDRTLSDLIGFTFQRMGAASAVNTFLERIHEIRKGLKTENAVIPVILDGENAWEHYPDNAREFLDRLYDALGSDESIQMVTPSEALDPARAEVLDRVVPGSWIGGRLSTWVGHPEKNRAWELLCRAKKLLEPYLPGLDRPTGEKVREQILIGEGSDWFWWFGDDHFTTLSDRFDELFRLHLVNAFRFAGVDTPSEYLQAIKKAGPRGHLRVPTDVISPILDGRVSNYFEWLHSGHFDLNVDQGPMHRSNLILRDLRYGFDGGFLYLKLGSEGDFAGRAKGLALAVEILMPAKRSIHLNVAHGEMEVVENTFSRAGVRAAAGKVAEIRLPLEVLGAGPGQEIMLFFSLFRGKELVEKAPSLSLVKILVPEDYDLEYWIV